MFGSSISLSLARLAPLAAVAAGLVPCLAHGAVDPPQECLDALSGLEKAAPGADVSSPKATLDECMTRDEFTDELKLDKDLSDRVDAMRPSEPAHATSQRSIDFSLAKVRIERAIDGKRFRGTPGANDYARRLEVRGPVDKALSPGAASVPDEVVALFTILADVAVKRAKRSGLAYLHERLESSVCDLRYDKTESKWTFGDDQTGESAMPATCTLLKNTTLDRIVSQPETLATAVVEDLLGTLSIKIVEQLGQCTEKSAKCTPAANEQVRGLVGLAVKVAARSLAAKEVTVQASDAELFIDILLDDHVNVRTHWKDPVIATALGALAVVMAEVRSGQLPTAVSISRIVHEIKPDVLTVPQTLEVIELVSLGLKGATATDSAGKPDIDTRLEASIQLVFAITYRIIDASGALASDPKGRAGLEKLEQLLLSALHRDVAATISAGAGFMQLVLESKQCAEDDEKCIEGVRKGKYDLQQLSTLLASVATYSSTYAKTSADATPEQLREARTAAVESAVDAFTDRHRRHGDVVLSLGLPVGFAAGAQFIRSRAMPTASVTYSLESMKPQLSLPLGFAVQRLPGRRYRAGKVQADRKFRWDGIHAQVTAIDLGQFVAYDADGDVTKPQWNTFMSYGGQVGWLIGSPSNAFVVAADVRYAPSLFPQGSDDPAQAQRVGGALRVGLFVAYYVSLFDFN